MSENELLEKYKDINLTITRKIWGVDMSATISINGEEFYWKSQYKTFDGVATDKHLSEILATPKPTCLMEPKEFAKAFIFD